MIKHNSSYISNPVDKAICKYKFHPSILFIKFGKLETFFISTHIKVSRGGRNSKY